MLDLLKKINMHLVWLNPVHVRNIAYYLQYTEGSNRPLLTLEHMSLLSSSCSSFSCLGVENKTACLILSMFKHLHFRLRQQVCISVSILMEIQKPFIHLP